MASLIAWLGVVSFLAPAVVAIAMGVWEGTIRPRRIPDDIINAEADDLTARFGEGAALAAFIEEQSAWYRSQTFEQGRWRRIRNVIERRQARR